VAEVLPFERSEAAPEDRPAAQPPVRESGPVEGVRGNREVPPAEERPVLVVDLGGQYSQLIARRVRECRVYSELVSHQTPAQAIRARNPRAIVLSGGPASVYADEAPEVDAAVWELGVPTLGICYGMQLMARDLGGRVERTGASEFGRTDLHAEGGALFEQVPEDQVVWMSHRDSVTAPPEGARVTGSSPSTPIAAFEAPERGLYGVQFHPEVVHTPHGNEVLKNFLYGVAGAPPTWTAAAVIEEQVERIRAQVGNARVLCALSGGVDSAVAALLVHKAVGDQLTCVFVDHGLLRKDEAGQVVETFQGHFQVPLVDVDAAARFLGRLEGVEDPEEKRKRIGGEFIRVFEEESQRLGRIPYLVQGTLYSDVIESGGTDGVAATIKSHHNVGGLPEDVDFELVEPLRLLFKDEVRRVGEELGLPEQMVWRQPFPGPGLAIRIIGEVTHERLEILREADSILQEEVRRAGLYRELWQAFAVLPAIRSVGVQGDERTYAYPIVIRAVTSEDAMTADWARLPYDLLETISSRIINEIPGVNRVALDISSKPPSTIEWE
jgi:GMP synthase (glutamine-hydrolysing)